MGNDKLIEPQSNTEYNSWLTDLKQRVRNAQTLPIRLTH